MSTIKTSPAANWGTSVQGEGPRFTAKLPDCHPEHQPLPRIPPTFQQHMLSCLQNAVWARTVNIVQELMEGTLCGPETSESWATRGVIFSLATTMLAASSDAEGLVEGRRGVRMSLTNLKQAQWDAMMWTWSISIPHTTLLSRL
jgi:hypothetical protein